ncbi:MAG: zinc ribbon domain-containing protein [Candidatus Nitrosopolaris sp.]
MKRGLQYCRKCYKKGTRKIQGLFKCKNCNISENADRNAALNIAYRALGYISKVGVIVGLPNTGTLASIDRSVMMTREATDFNQW